MLISANRLSGLVAVLMLGTALPVMAADDIRRQPGQQPEANSLEQSIWEETRKSERAARTSGERNHDPELNAYLKGILDKVSGEYKGDLRLYVMNRPFFNASMAPNGYTEVWTGLLLRAQTEDEVAFVMGHEFAHFRQNHSIRAFENVKANQNAATAATIVIAVVGAGAAANAGSYSAARDISNLTRGLVDAVYLGSIAAYFGYSRETEEDADLHGGEVAHLAGYDPYAGARIWRFLLDETAASDYERTRRSPSRINIFGSHPLEIDRISAIESAAKKRGATPLSDEDLKQQRLTYRQNIRPYLAQWLRDDLRRQDYGQTLFIIERLSIDNQDQGLLNFYAAEAYRLRGKGDDLTKAVTHYQTALTFEDAPATTWRQLGDVYRRLESTDDALMAFGRYITLHPDAEDVWMVEDQMTALKSGATASVPDNHL
ncbi:M48 family metallopeptidase [Asticcacaulis tiandongensis]|uniref:M48 family metallopeptidase n=1 Tax=Asticcacaulis tiandongensis TaxID=2565365 RepID=UPI00112CE01B|nr:M48 family metallopeptidase [Asticcacaulis tiandongensis]